MKISRLKLKNIKCFEDLEISFEDENGGIKNWSLIVGDNGSGKTTILRSLAAGLCYQEGVSALLAELNGGFLTQGKDKGSIEVGLKEKDSAEEIEIITKIKRVKKNGNDESISQPKGYKIDRKKLFAVAYGAGRGVTGTQSYREYALVDAVYSLFNYDNLLQNMELSIRRISTNEKECNSNEKKRDALMEVLKKVLMFDEGVQISLETDGLRVKKSKWGEKYFDDLSDGYQSLTSVIVDFLHWKQLSVGVEKFTMKELSGIFIIDEIEQHLHPIWQRNIIKILAEQFPKMQFISSTYTPICALGLSDLECASQLIKVADEDGHSKSEVFDLGKDYKGYRYDQILGSDIFDLSGIRSISIEKKLNEYREIYRKDENERDAEEKQRFEEIKNELKDLPVWDDEKDKEVRREFLELLKLLKQRSNDQD